jgi:uncharacterized protein with NRDE domain
MCVTFVARHVNSAFPLIVASNRDEFFARPAEAAGFWPDSPRFLGGRDQEAGGAWLGVSLAARWAVVMNFRDPSAPSAGTRSRGELVPAFALSDQSALSWMAELSERQAEYRPFNLLVGDGAENVCFLGYREPVPFSWPEGVSGISNGPARAVQGEPAWPKVSDGARKLAEILEKGTTLPEREILTLLRDESPAEDGRLPNTGIGLERERALSSIFVRLPGYGTRCSTLLALGADGKVYFTEVTYDERGEIAQHRHFEFIRRS